MFNSKRFLGVSLALALASVGCGQPVSSGDDNTSVEVARSALTGPTTQINCGNIVGFAPFVADTDFSGGSYTTFPASTPLPDDYGTLPNFAPDLVYHTGRSGNSTYTVPGYAPGSRNVVRLHFIELQKNSLGQRRFNVTINGIQVLTDFDIFVAAGGTNRRVIREFTMGADLNGKYTIKFVAGSTDVPIVSGLEVVPSTLPQATQIATGQPAIGAFADDVGFSGGGAKTRTNTITTAGVLHAGPPALYDSQRYGSFSYTVPGFSAGSSNVVRLHFAETNSANFSVGKRKFNVAINGATVLSSFDIFAAGGGNKAVVREFYSQADGSGNYNLQFTTVADAATVSGIEVLPGVSWSMRTAMTGAEYQAEFDARIANGYRITYVDGYSVGGTPMFSAVFDLKTGPAQVASHNMSPTDLQTKDDQMTAAGFHISMLNGYAFGTAQLFAAIWEAGVIANHFQHHDLTAAQYQAEFTAQVGAGFKLLHVSGYTVNGTDFYAPIWEKRASGPGWFANHLVTDAQLQTIINNAQAPGSNQRIIDLSAYNLGGTLRYTVIVEAQTQQPFDVNHNVPRALFQQQQLDHYRQGYAPVVIPAAAAASGAEVHAGLWRNDAFSQADLTLIETTHTNAPVATLPSDSIAITKNGRLVFAKAWGTSNGTTPATTSNLYRIASVSKPITSIGILKLVEQGKLNLNQTVFGPGALLGTQFPGPFGTGVQSITVKQLMSHTSGISEPDFLHVSNGYTSINKAISDAIAKPVTVLAAGTSQYSNIAYAILGRIIEKFGATDYISWTQTNVLQPIGITDMRLGETAINTPFPNEVVYTPPSAATGGTYDWNLKLCDSFGGWIATPVDVVRFGIHTMGLSNIPSIISPLTVAESFVGLAGTTYSTAWVNSGSIIWKDGDLPPGTQSYIVKHTGGDGILWAGVTNSHNLDLFHAGHEQIDQPAPNPAKPGLAEIAVTWPDRDFFLDQ